MKRNIAIVAGGDSGEYEISINSASVVAEHIDKVKYNPYVIVIRNSEWIYRDEAGLLHHVDKNDFSLSLGGKKIRFSCIYIAIHGTPGEDGKLQAYFELLGIPYTTADVVTSALTFNKNFCKGIIRSFGLLTPRWLHFYKGDLIPKKGIAGEIGFPCFVKPSNGGSSVGMSKVQSLASLDEAIKRAFHEDTEIVIEEYIEGIEITCGVFRNKKEMIIFPLTEIVSKKEFFDYEAKYVDGMADEITPARIDEIVEQKCKTTSAFLYNKLNCHGLVRFDYIVKKGKTKSPALYFLEVNTVPGLSTNSIIPKMARAMDISLTDLYSMVIEDALYRFKK